MSVINLNYLKLDTAQKIPEVQQKHIDHIHQKLKRKLPDFTTILTTHMPVPIMSLKLKEMFLNYQK